MSHWRAWLCHGRVQSLINIRCAGFSGLRTKGKHKPAHPGKAFALPIASQHASSASGRRAIEGTKRPAVAARKAAALAAAGKLTAAQLKQHKKAWQNRDVKGKSRAKTR